VPEPPKASVAVLQDSLGARGPLGVQRLHTAQPDQLSATLPHQVYVLGRDEATNGDFTSAKLSGWRYLLEADRDVVASAETRVDGDGHHSFAHINEGPFVKGTVSALSVADRAASEAGRELEFAVLHVPALYLMSIWLRPAGTENQDDSLFVPIAPAPAGIDANAVYTSDMFGTLVAELAQRVPGATVDDLTGGA
jgi:hypothetical protein